MEPSAPAPVIVKEEYARQDYEYQQARPQPPPYIEQPASYGRPGQYPYPQPPPQQPGPYPYPQQQPQPGPGPAPKPQVVVVEVKQKRSEVEDGLCAALGCLACVEVGCCLCRCLIGN